ncbi:hypothetical protein I6E60_09765 [Salinibacterium sp. SWN167]|nr:hypothetical protein [Salinibacterium sp. SWN167]
MNIFSMVTGFETEDPEDHRVTNVMIDYTPVPMVFIEPFDPVQPAHYRHVPEGASHCRTARQTGLATYATRQSARCWRREPIHENASTRPSPGAVGKMNCPGFLAAFFLVKGCSYTQVLSKRGS